MKKIIGYARVSTADQAEFGQSMEAQEAAIRAYAASKGYELLQIVRDDGYSGAKPLADRPGGARLLKALAAAKGAGVVATKLDRMFRSAIDCLTYLEAWKVGSTALHLLDYGGDTVNTATPMGKCIMTNMAAFAELERAMIAERTRVALAHKRTKGEYTGGDVPYGWRLADDGDHIVQDEQEQATANVVRELGAEGLSLQAIATRLDEMGMRSRSGKPFHKMAVSRLVSRAKAAQPTDSAPA